jgi:topoisomerase IV subunit A
MIDNPDATSEELLQFVKGPDFPTGGFLVGSGASGRLSPPAVAR